MRSIIHRIVLLIALTVVPFALEAAKPVYCSESLRRCVAECREFWGPLQNACQAGCAIGYLSCGS
jgi:hypothetical protein